MQSSEAADRTEVVSGKQATRRKVGAEPPAPRTRPTHAAYLAVRTFSSLDALRCISILAVVYHHAHGGFHGWGISEFGFLGVDLFFVISGFLIVTLLLRERERTGTISLRKFFARRTLRIMPLYYAVVAVSALLYASRPESPTSERFFAELPFVLTYTTNWVHSTTLLNVSWSLSAEEQFYLVWPSIQKYVKHTVAVLAVLIGGSQLIHFGLIDPWLEAWFGWGPKEPIMLRQITFTPILLGVLLAHVLHSSSGFALAARTIGGRFTPAVMLGVLAVTLAVMPADLTGFPRLFIHGALTLLVASCVIREDHALTRAFSIAPVRRIGAISYGMYLWHMFALDVALRLADRGLGPYSILPITLVGTIVLAELSYRYFETPFLRLKARYASDAHAVSAGPTR